MVKNFKNRTNRIPNQTFPVQLGLTNRPELPEPAGLVTTMYKRVSSFSPSPQPDFPQTQNGLAAPTVDRTPCRRQHPKNIYINTKQHRSRTIEILF